jgi:hypothetical protein
MLTDVTDPYGKTVERSGLACRGDGKSSRALIIGSDKHGGGEDSDCSSGVERLR